MSSSSSDFQFIKKASETQKRSIAKTVSWRLLGSLDTFLITYFITGEAKIGAFVATAEVLTKIVLYYFHERCWSHIRWGMSKK